MQEINNIVGLLENLLNHGGKDGLPERLVEKINAVLDKTKEELKLLNLKIVNIQAISDNKMNDLKMLLEQQYNKKLIELDQKAKSSLEAAIKTTSEQAYASAYDKIGQEFASKVRCVKCGNNKILIKHDYRADVLGCTCNICGWEWDKDCLDKKQ